MISLTKLLCFLIGIGLITYSIMKILFVEWQVQLNHMDVFPSWIVSTQFNWQIVQNAGERIWKAALVGIYGLLITGATLIWVGIEKLLKPQVKT